MAAVILPIILVPTVAKTVLVVDAIFSTGGRLGFVGRAARTIHSQASGALVTSTAPVSPRQQPNGATSAGAPKVRSLHRRLLSMHVTSTLSQSAGVAKYLLPVSDTSCVVTHRILVALLLLYDASLVVFLQAKVKVTNGNRTLACWEKGILWWSRFYGWVYLPVAALGLGLTFPGSTNPEATFCYNGMPMETASDTFTAAKNARSFGFNYASLIVQFILLLGMFVKPMLARVQGTQSGGAVYRRVVLRNLLSTTGIVISYAITTLVVVLALLRENVNDNKSAQIRDVALALNGLGTLCLTEVALPLGFLSCMKACSAGTDSRSSTHTQAAGHTAKTGTATAGTAGKIKVAPTEGLLPDAP